MTTRMLCLDCGTTDYPRTRLPGSDATEAVGWLLGGLPGWLYCAWRHALRAKVCSACGSGALARESRAHAAASPAAPPGRAAEDALAGDASWPAPWRTPRGRLRAGGGWIAAWALAVAGLPALGAGLGATWLAAQLARAASAPRCDAWDAAGRSLRIEIV